MSERVTVSIRPLSFIEKKRVMRAVIQLFLFGLCLGVAIAQMSLPNCATDGSSYGYVESFSDADTRHVVSNSCPNHPHDNSIGDNPNNAKEQEVVYKVPAYPRLWSSQTTSLAEQGGAVGILFNGAMLFSAYGGPMYGAVTSYDNSAVFAEGDTFDFCGCHADSNMRPSYHCHVPPACLLRQLGHSSHQHSPQIGWAADGFPVYGPRGPGGTMMKPCGAGSSVCVDSCGGYAGTSVGDGYTYRYYMMGEYGDGETCEAPIDPLSTSVYYPFTPICLRGCCPDGMDCRTGGLVIPDCDGTEDDGTVVGFSPSLVDALETNEVPAGCISAASSSLQTMSSVLLIVVTFVASFLVNT